MRGVNRVHSLAVSLWTPGYAGARLATTTSSTTAPPSRASLSMRGALCAHTQVAESGFLVPTPTVLMTAACCAAITFSSLLTPSYPARGAISASEMTMASRPWIKTGTLRASVAQRAYAMSTSPRRVGTTTLTACPSAPSTTCCARGSHAWPAGRGAQFFGMKAFRAAHCKFMTTSIRILLQNSCG